MTATSTFHPNQEAAYVSKIIELMQEVKTTDKIGVVERMIKRAQVTGERAEILQRAFQIWKDIPVGGDPRDVPGTKKKSSRPSRAVLKAASTSPFAPLLAIRPELVRAQHTG